MKKHLFTIIAIVGIMSWLNMAAVSAQTTKVWITTGKSATKYHKQKDCRAIKRLDPNTIKQMTVTEAKNTWGRTECLFCYGKTTAATAKKPTEKKVTEKKTETKPKAAPTEKLVWVTTEGKATKYHKQKNCRSLKSIAPSTLKQVKVSEAEDKMGRSECLFCYGKASSEASAKKVAEKKATAKKSATKTATKKATTSEQKTTTKKATTTKETSPKKPATKTATKKATTSEQKTTTKKATSTKETSPKKPATTTKATQKAA